MAKKNIGVSVGIIPWFYDHSTERVYFLMGHPSNKPNDYWLYMRGMAEDWEKMEETALREFQEESGIDLSSERSRLQYLGMVKQREGKNVAAYGLEFIPNSKMEEVLCPFVTSGMHSNMCCGGTVPEIDGYAWMTFEEVTKFTNETNLPFFISIVKSIQRTPPVIHYYDKNM